MLECCCGLWQDLPILQPCAVRNNHGALLENIALGTHMLVDLPASIVLVSSTDTRA